MNSAAQCLSAKGFLPHTKATMLTFGYLLDEKSYPGEKMLYVVNYPNPSRPDGLVFTIFLTKRDGRQHVNIQNNARFTMSKGSDEGVSFATPPLGGTWSAQHLVSAIKQIAKQPRFTVLPEYLLSKSSDMNYNSQLTAPHHGFSWGNAVRVTVITPVPWDGDTCRRIISISRALAPRRPSEELTSAIRLLA